MNLKDHSELGLTDQRKEHTLRTIEAVGILKDAFLEIERLNLENQRLRDKIFTASMNPNG